MILEAILKSLSWPLTTRSAPLEITRLRNSSEDKDQALMLPRERQSSFHPFIQVLEIQRLKLNPAIKFIAE